MIKPKKEARSYSLKVENIEKIERIAYENKKKKSEIVDKMAEEFEDGSN